MLSFKKTYYSKTQQKIKLALITYIIIMTFISPLTINASTPLDTLNIQKFDEDKSIFTNPERGWHRIYKTDDIYQIDELKDKGISLTLLELDLENFSSSDISEAKLEETRNAFNKIRAYNLSVIFRVGYTFKTEENQAKYFEPENPDLILRHIEQLAPILQENEDILFSVQAGFLGPYGEWHNSRYAPNDSAIPTKIKKDIVFTLLDILPETVSVQIRRPMFVRELFNEEPGGSTLTENDAYGKSFLSRIGVHNDAVLTTHDDYGTYRENGYDREAELKWSDNHMKYTPFLGEINVATERSDPENAIRELNLLHALSLNGSYSGDIMNDKPFDNNGNPIPLGKWQTTSYEDMSMYNYVGNNLGYRFVLSETGLNNDTKKGGSLHLKIAFENEGFGNLIREKDFEIVLSNGDKIYKTKISDDARKWYKEAGEITKDYYFSIPNDIDSGLWNVSLGLSSTFDSLKNNPNYSIRFANKDIWDEKNGLNNIGSVNIQNSLDNNVSSFKEISKEEAEKLTLISNNKAKISGFDVYHDLKNIYFKIDGNMLDTKSQIFINTDNNTSTGLKHLWKTSGFEYLIENNTLYRYSGTNNKWSWYKIKKISNEKSNNEIFITLPISLLKNTSNTININFISNDDVSLSYPLVDSNKTFAYNLN